MIGNLISVPCTSPPAARRAVAAKVTDERVKTTRLRTGAEQTASLAWRGRRDDVHFQGKGLQRIAH